MTKAPLNTKGPAGKSPSAAGAAAEPERLPPQPTTPLQRSLLVGALLLELAWLGFLIVLVWKK